METKDIALIIGMVGSNLGGLCIIAKYVTGSVMKHNETLPALIQTVEKIDKNQTNLFDRMREAEGDIKHTKGICEERGKQCGRN